MKRNRLVVTYLIAVTATFSFSCPARADYLLIDNGSQINSYNLALANPAGVNVASVQAGAQIMGLAVSDTPSGPLLLGAATGLSEILAFPSTGATNDFSVSNPVGLAIDASGNVYTAANNGASLEEFSSTGTMLKTIANVSHQDVQSEAFDGSGDLFYADNHTGDLFEYTAGGTTKTIATNLNGSNFYGMAVDGSGDVFLSFWSLTVGGTNGIFEIAPNGSLSTFYTAAANVLPTGLAIDPGSGNLYMSYITSSNGSSGGADVFTSTGGALSATPAVLAASGSLNSDYGLAIITPEPGTVPLLAGGLLSIVFLYFRRSSRKPIGVI